LLDNNISRVQIGHVIGFVALLSGKVYLTSSLVLGVSTTASSAIIIIIIPLKSFPRILLEPFGHTILLEIAYLVASLASDIDVTT